MDKNKQNTKLCHQKRHDYIRLLHFAIFVTNIYPASKVEVIMSKQVLEKCFRNHFIHPIAEKFVYSKLDFRKFSVIINRFLFPKELIYTEIKLLPMISGYNQPAILMPN